MKMSAKNRYLNNNKAEQEQKLKEQEEKKAAEDKLFTSLKRHIMRERERKKQLEAETAKEEQLRNEREARKKADKMTLGKTQQEIAQVEEQLIQLKNKKQQLFLQLKVLITKEVEMEKIRKDNDKAMNVRNESSPYPAYGVSDKGIKRSRSPISQGDYYKHSSQGVYLPPKDQRGVDTGRAVLWYNPAKYGTPPQHQWPMTNNIVSNRYQIPQPVPPRHILISDHQQLPPPQLVKQQAPSAASVQKSSAISIEKINDPMRPKLPSQQQDLSIHRRINPAGQNQQQNDFQNPPYHVRHEY